MSEKVAYPQYRKLNARSFYKIVSENELTEIQIVGKKVIKHHINSGMYMNKLFINDLLTCDSGRYNFATEDEFQAMEKSAD